MDILSDSVTVFDMKRKNNIRMLKASNPLIILAILIACAGCDKTPAIATFCASEPHCLKLDKNECMKIDFKSNNVTLVSEAGGKLGDSFALGGDPLKAGSGQAFFFPFGKLKTKAGGGTMVFIGLDVSGKKIRVHARNAPPEKAGGPRRNIKSCKYSRQ